MQAKNKNNLYVIEQLDNLTTIENHANITYSCNNKECLELWHIRLGHRNYEAIKIIVKMNY